MGWDSLATSISFLYNSRSDWKRNSRNIKTENEKKILIPIILSTYTEMSRSEESKEKFKDEKETDKTKSKSTLYR